jgi:hypothetical protein
VVFDTGELHAMRPDGEEPANVTFLHGAPEKQ